jgi:hypothetical protein
MAWYNDVWDYAKENALELAKMGGAGAKAYIDIKDQKRRNELEKLLIEITWLMLKQLVKRHKRLST